MPLKTKLYEIECVCRCGPLLIAGIEYVEPSVSNHIESDHDREKVYVLFVINLRACMKDDYCSHSQHEPLELRRGYDLARWLYMVASCPQAGSTQYGMCNHHSHRCLQHKLVIYHQETVKLYVRRQLSRGLQGIWRASWCAAVRSLPFRRGFVACMRHFKSIERLRRSSRGL